MTNYVLLLRSVNVGGRNKVTMANLKEQLENLGFNHATSYINSGNLLFSSELATKSEVRQAVTALLEKYYDFSIPFTLLSFEEYSNMIELLPTWWWETDHHRRNALFLLPGSSGVQPLEEALLTENEQVFEGEHAIFWVVNHKEGYSRTRYSKFASHPLYKKVTIRNANTVDKIAQLIVNFPKD